MTKGRSIIVTGAASGIGLAITRRLRALGDRVAGLDINEAALADVDADLRLAGDVSDESSVEAALRATATTFGGLDACVIAAGVSIRGTVSETTVQDWDRVLAVNLRGTYLTAKHAVPHLRAAGGGSIITIASQLGIVATKAAAAYCASKGGVLSLTRAMALDLASENITVNAVCPGPTATPMSDAYFADPDERGAFIGRIPTGRFAEPNEIAAAVEYLLGDGARSTTGIGLIVDGGYVAQ